MAKDVQIGTVRVQGEDLDCYADTEGKWTLARPVEEGEDETYLWNRVLGRGDSLDAAKRSARKALKENVVEVAVPFKLERRKNTYGGEKELELVDGTGLRLRAGSNSKVIVTIDGKRDEIEAGHMRKVWGEEVPMEIVEEKRRLRKQSSEIAERLREIEDEFEFDLSRAVREAVREEAAIQADADEEREPDAIAPAGEEDR